MQETPEQYIKRVLGYIQGQEPLGVQQATAKRIERLIRPLTRQQTRRRPAAGKWSIGEILAHLAESELVYGYRIRMILAANGTRFHAFDQIVWARNSDYARQDPQRSLRMFRALRESNLALLKSLPRTKWGCYGIHATRGKETLKRVVEMFAGHDLNHLQQINRIANQSKGHGK